MPLIIFVTHVPVEMGDRALQHRLLRPAVVVDAGDDRADGSFPRGNVGSVAGLVGFGGAMGGIVSNLIAGRLLDLGMGYGTVFSIMGMCHVTAFVIILLTIRNIQSLVYPTLRSAGRA